jgi:lipopolysaccharide/colanic/teichoic acid biosynthesis glycosyltransferase
MLSGVMLVVTLPILFVSAAVTAVLSKQSPLVAHRRIGQGGRTIWVLKMRTMWGGVSCGRRNFVERLRPAQLVSAVPKMARDPRVTSRFAAACRRYSIDELPQLWNVLRGDLALVGPRPLTREEIDTYYGPDTAELLARKPGITGLWQIRGRSRLTFRQRRRFDLFLLRKWSLRLYLGILIATVPKVVAGKDAC